MRASQIVNRRKVGAWEVGDFLGFHVAREIGFRTWQFNICGFLDTTCRLAMADGSSMAGIPIDSKNRITINGTKYTQKNWTH